ncbi:uncharacterized protein [Nicotiana tomentosiformis]|uniref:uncharacterized protein isoform X3 n=1 Tax=Nicotiana tomentosiformis TaxID=4098 RepID=UPI00388CAC54
MENQKSLLSRPSIYNIQDHKRRKKHSVTKDKVEPSKNRKYSVESKERVPSLSDITNDMRIHHLQPSNNTNYSVESEERVPSLSDITNDMQNNIGYEDDEEYPGGRTAHSRFAIPLNPTEDSTCNIKQGSPLAKLIVKAKLIIWDEAPMMHKYCFEALDQTLRDILRFKDPSNLDQPLGGKTIVLGGDFRQILLVITKGSRYKIPSRKSNSCDNSSDGGVGE